MNISFPKYKRVPFPENIKNFFRSGFFRRKDKNFFRGKF